MVGEGNLVIGDHFAITESLHMILHDIVVVSDVDLDFNNSSFCTKS